jgi:hypothetical protein
LRKKKIKGKKDANFQFTTDNIHFASYGGCKRGGGGEVKYVNIDFSFEKFAKKGIPTTLHSRTV